MPRLKRTVRKLPQKKPRGPAFIPDAITAAPASQTEDIPSRRTRSSNRNSAAARTVERAIHDESFHSDPGQDEIKYSDNDDDDDEDDDDPAQDSDDDDDPVENSDDDDDDDIDDDAAGAHHHPHQPHPTNKQKHTQDKACTMTTCVCCQ